MQTEDRRPIIDTLAPIGRVSALDLPRDRILGEHAGRIIRQLDCLESGKEIINPALELEMQHVSFPVHFLDIETIRTSVPVHRGGRVNGLTLFQFSVHTRQFMRGPLVHHAWLNTETADPNRTFLRALRAVLGDLGTVLIWTEYERQCFHELLNELLTVGPPDADTAWLQALLFGDRMFDQHRLCYDYYQHPLMGGRTSIKAVLPAVWSEDSPVKLMAPYVDFPQDIDPYAALHQAGNVSDGCNAMEAYLALMTADIETRQKVKNGLLKYCHVDTAAMAYVWDYWEWSLLRQRLHDQMAEKTVLLG
ncbi:MAG: DUF2779 domain-containing protein [Opitutaceae bacterium]|nr:DUF2779 domain-containing protein [Opitutaceae bacterium]